MLHFDLNFPFYTLKCHPQLVISMELSADLFYIGSGLVTAAFGALGAKYWQAKKGLSTVNSTLKAVKDNLVDVSDLIDTLDNALADDNITTAEAQEIVSKIREVIDIEMPE